MTYRQRPEESSIDEDRSVRRSLAVVERTAGALQHQTKHPPLTPKQELGAFERGVAEQVMESMEG